MNFLRFLLPPLALLTAAATPLPAVDGDLQETAKPVAQVLTEAQQTPVQQQVRIEQRIVIRIAPIPSDTRQRMSAIIPPMPREGRYKEEKLHGCVPVSSIAWIQPGDDNRLMLVLRDRRVLSAALERRCHAEEFYQGAYVERSEDGQLCARRERLQSRTGSSCQVAKLSRLVARK